jgi:membrane associated rhomboid family serine protease
MEVSDDPPPRTRCVRRSGSKRELERPSLVLTALDIDNAIDFDGHVWGLWVADADAVRAEAELSSYAEEVHARPPPRPVVAVVDNGIPGILAYLSIIWLLPSLEADATFGLDWLSRGEMDAGLVMHGEWWRTITALTLHADLGHLVANSLAGVVFGVLVGRHFGSGLGWLLVLVCGALGNAADAMLQESDFHSIGASTATFAAIGMVGAFVWRRGYYRTLDWRRSFAPIFAAVALLAYTGVEGENIDVIAHVMGFAVGLICGFAAAPFDLRRLGAGAQTACGVVAVAIVAFAWTLAGHAAS